MLSRLAMGTGTNGVGGSSNQTRKLGVNGLADLFRAGYDQGLNFFDAADQYGTHPHVRQALKSVPREKITVLSKTHASTAAEMRADLDRFLEAVVVGEGVDDLPLGQGWRRELLGDDLIRLAAGEVVLSMNREAPYLRIEERPAG